MRVTSLPRLIAGLLVWIMTAVPVLVLPATGVTVIISPTSVTVPVGGERQFTAQVNGAADTVSHLDGQ